MIKFKYVQFQNFGSFGNNPTKINLDKHRTTLVSGMNGHGKSFALLDSITFALFGKPFRKINIPQLVNTINEKSCLVEVDFCVGEDEYKVIRGIKPKRFEIYKNDSLINQDAKAKDYQKMLEENILKMNYKSFTQVVILGSSSFVPFMQLSALDRRQVIEDVLDIQVFSEMNVVLKNRVSLKKEELKDLERDMETIKSKIEMLESHIETLRELDESKLKDLKEEIEEIQEGVEEKEKAIDSLLQSQTILLDKTSKIETIKKSLNKFENTRTMIKSNHDRVQRTSQETEEMQTCPTCTQDVPDETKQILIEKFESKKKQYSDGLMKIDKEIESVNEELDSLREVSLKLKSVQEKIVQLRGEVDSNKKYTIKLQKEVKVLSEKVSDSESSNTSTELKDNKIELNELLKTKNEYKEDALLLGCVGNLLKDTGIKSKIIRHYLPIINKLINKYLADMGFFAQFHLDENFNETIKSRHRDTFSYMSFSEGEKMRIDLALLLAWREIARLKNSANTNLLILDEVFDSSLDVVGTDEFLKLMNVLSGNTNIFVISHKSDQLIDKFENQITFVKKGNFSRLI